MEGFADLGLQSMKRGDDARYRELAVPPAARERRFQRDMSARIQEYRFETGAPEAGERVDAFLARRISWRSRSQIRRLIERQRVTLEAGRSELATPASEVRPSTRLRAGQEVVLRIDLSPDGTSDGATGGEEADGPEVVWEDERVVAVDKPSGVSIYPTRRHRHGSLIEAVHRRARREHPDGHPPSPCHRLDRETSGVVLFAKDPEARAHLGQQFEDRVVGKVYWAIVRGVPSRRSGVVEAALASDPESVVELRQGLRPPPPAGDGKEATTAWRVERAAGDRALLRLEPRTGRPHQLRVHCLALGHPILGDKLYLGGDEIFLRSLEGELPAEDLAVLGHHRLALHAGELSFLHPESGARVVARSPLPAELAALLGSEPGAR